MESDRRQVVESGLGNAEEINVLDWVLTMSRRKRFITLIPLAMSVICFVLFAFVVSPIFQGIARVLPPQATSSTTTQLLSQLSGATGAFAAMIGGGTSSDLYVGLLQSQTVLDTIIERFGLLEQYKNDRLLGQVRSFTIDDAREELVDRIAISTDSAMGGIITIAIEDKDPQKAADMANAFIVELKNLMQRLAVTDASRRRVFFETEVKAAREALVRAEEALARFQTTSGAIELGEQARAILTGIAALGAQVAGKEMQLQVMKTYTTEYNPDYKKAHEELEALREQLKKLENREGKLYSSNFIPTSEIPELATEYLRRMREFKYQETLYELLVKQYEVARLDEARDSSLIQEVDKAVPPVNKASPKPILIMILAGGVMFFFAVLLAFISEAISRSKLSPGDEEKWGELTRSMRSI